MLDRSGNILDWSDVCWTYLGLTIGFLGSWTGRGQARPVQDKSEGPGMKLDQLGKRLILYFDFSSLFRATKTQN